MQNETDKPSVFEDLLHEARTSAYRYASDQSSSRWTRRIIWLLLAQFVLALILTVIQVEVAIIGGWLFALFAGIIVCGCLAIPLSALPFPKKWQWEWRFVYIFQLLFFAFSLTAGCVLLLVVIPSIAGV